MSVGLGLRAKELTSLRWSDVYEPTGKVRQVLHLKAAYTKGAKTRDVFLSAPPLRRLLADYAEKHPGYPERFPDRALFASQKRGHMTPSSMARFLKMLYRDAGILGASSHSGRRTLITGLAERGIDLKAIAQIAGHASVKTTAVYVESNPARLARILRDVSW
jgi:integrase/recombinase XerD